MQLPDRIVGLLLTKKKYSRWVNKKGPQGPQNQRKAVI